SRTGAEPLHPPLVIDLARASEEDRLYAVYGGRVPHSGSLESTLLSGRFALGVLYDQGERTDDDLTAALARGPCHRPPIRRPPAYAGAHLATDTVGAELDSGPQLRRVRTGWNHGLRQLSIEWIADQLERRLRRRARDRHRRDPRCRSRRNESDALG